MVTHGHGDGAYAHNITNLWPKDLNFVILSLVGCLHALGKKHSAKFQKTI